jgi:hypothetical protein
VAKNRHGETGTRWSWNGVPSSPPSATCPIWTNPDPGKRDELPLCLNTQRLFWRNTAWLLPAAPCCARCPAGRTPCVCSGGFRRSRKRLLHREGRPLRPPSPSRLRLRRRLRADVLSAERHRVRHRRRRRAGPVG